MKPDRIDTYGIDSGNQSIPIDEESSSFKRLASLKQSFNSNRFSIFDVVGTWHIFGLLVLPFSWHYYLIPNSWKYNISVIPLLPSRDIVDESVSMALTGSTSSKGSSGVHNRFHVVHKEKDGYHELHTDINVLAYVKSYVQLPLVNVSLNICNGTSNSDEGPFTGSIVLTSRLFDHRNISTLSIPYSSVLSNDTIALSDFKLFNRNCSQILAKAAEPLAKEVNLMMPLMMQSFDAPHVLTADNHWMAFRFQSVDISSKLSVMPEYVLITHNSDYNELICLMGLMLSLVTLVIVVHNVIVISRHAWHQNKEQISLSSRSGSEVDTASGVSTRSWLSCCQHYCLCVELLLGSVTTEQHISVLLLVSLFFWQNPVRCGYVLYHYWYSGFPSNTGLLIAGLSSGLSYFGLQCFLALYISSLKYSKLSHQHSTSSSAQHTPLSGAAATSGFGSHQPVQKSAYFSPSNTRSPPPPVPHSSSAVSAYYNSQFWLYSSSQQWTDRYRIEYDRVASLENRRRLHEEEQRNLLVNYTLNKLLLLLSTWVLVALYWTMKFPELCRRVFTIADSSADDSLAYKVCYSLVEYALILLSLVWIKIVLNSLYVTAVKLKKSNYLNNRFHQIAYILIVAQINLGLLVLLLCSIWNVSLMGIAASGFQLYGRYEVLDWLQYLTRWLDYAGGLHALISAGPLAPPSMSLFLFVTALVYSIAYVALPVSINLAGDNDDMGRFVGENRSYYITLERYDHLRAFNIVRKMSVVQRRAAHQQLRKLLLEREYQPFMRRYVAWKSVTRRSSVFCLETACLLLEASYQAYFPAKKAASASAAAVAQAAGPHPLSRKNSERSPLSASDKHKSINSQASSSASHASSALAGEFISGPVLDLTRLGLELVDTFQEASVSTFGYLGVQYTLPHEDPSVMIDSSHGLRRELSGAVVAFRGSTAANFVIDFKFALIPLPDLKHSRAYFVDIIRAYQKGDTGASSEPAASGVRSGGGTGVAQSKSHHDFCELLDAVESGMEGTADDHSRKYYQLNSRDDVETAGASGSTGEDAGVTSSGKIRDSPPQTVLRKMKAVGSKIPLVKEGFPRVHAGFWQAYASIREQVLVSVVRVIAQHRQQYCSLHHSDEELVSGSEVDVSASDSDAATGVEMQSRSSSHKHLQHTTKHHVSVNDLALDLSEIKPLQLHFTGHSLGGTMASLAALDIATNMDIILEALCYVDYIKPHTLPSQGEPSDALLRAGLSNLSYLRTWLSPELSVYTYGCPRIGNLAFMELMRRSVETNYRVSLNGDLVPMVPKIPGYYYHSGVNVVIDEEEKGSLIVKPSLVEQWLLRRTTGSLNNHSLDKYRDCLEACFEEVELKEYLSKALEAGEDSQFPMMEEGEGVMGGMMDGGINNSRLSVGSSSGVIAGGGRASLGSGNRRISAGKAIELPEWLISDR